MSDRYLLKNKPAGPGTPKQGARRQKHISTFFSSELGETVLLKKLRSGGIFLKHGTQGFPHYRFVWCDDDLKSICWGDLHRRKVHGRILTQDLVRVAEGHDTKTFKRAPKSCDSYRCLSLVTVSRTLDLETVAEDERELWVMTFRYLIENYQLEPPVHTSLNSPNPNEESLDEDCVSSNRSSDNEGTQVPRSNVIRHPLPGVEGSTHRNSGSEKQKGPLANVLSSQSHRNSGSGEGGNPHPHPHPHFKRSPGEKGRDSLSAAPPSGPGKSVMDMIAAMQERVEVAEQRASLLLKECDHWKEDNKRLYLSHSKQVVRVHESVDLLTRQIRQLTIENEALKKALGVGVGGSAVSVDGAAVSGSAASVASGSGAGMAAGMAADPSSQFLEALPVEELPVGRAASSSVGGFPIMPNQQRK